MADKPSDHVLIRNAEQHDLSAITAIYAHHVLHGTGSFEEVPPSEDDMRERWQPLVENGFPYRVLCVEGAVCGYAYAGPYKLRSAYRFTVEDSIYLAPEHTGQGHGRRLLTDLVELCRKGDYRQMLAVIGDSNNHASIGLHRSLGFELLGTARGVGFKHESWLDIVFMQRSL